MPLASRGLINCSSDGLFHMASQFNTVGRHRAFLALTFRASLKAFAVVFRAAVAVVLEQRNGVVDLFWTAKGRLQTRQLHSAKRDCCRKSSFFHTASSYSCDSLIAAVGQTSSQRPQKMQRPRLNSRASSPVARSVSTVKAFDGQALTQAAQPMHCCGFCSGLPRKFYQPQSAPADKTRSPCRF